MPDASDPSSAAGPFVLPSVLEPFLTEPSRVGVFTDFDGTLAPIVASPDAAVPLDGVIEVLEELAARVGRVAVISGRPVEFLQRFFTTSPVRLSGLYGLQAVVDGERRDDPRADDWRHAVDGVVADAAVTGPTGMQVEPKGLSVTLHYREHPDAAEAVAAWAVGQGERSGLELRSARMSVELHPPVDTDKGAVVTELAEGLDTVCFLGDDVGDLPAFAALDQLRAEGRTVAKVVVGSSELAPELAATADVTVAGPTEALILLRALADQLPDRG